MLIQFTQQIAIQQISFTGNLDMAGKQNFDKYIRK